MSEARGVWEIVGLNWMVVDDYLEPIRIPLFFAISGILASSRVFGPLVRARSRIVIPLYLYFLWSVLLASRDFIPGTANDSFKGSALSFLADVFLVCSGYWYLFSLPLYFILARVTANINVLLVLCVLLVPYMLREHVEYFANEVASDFTDSSSLLGSVCANMVFFVAGVRLRGKILISVSVIKVPVALFGFALYFSLVFLAHVSGSQVLVLCASVIGILVTANLAMRFGRSRSSRGLQVLGSRTLPVYVLQFFFVSILAYVWGKYSVSISNWPRMIAVMYAPVAAILIALTSSYIYVLAGRMGLGLLFAPPKRWT